jgi:hypothetical protein
VIDVASREMARRFAFHPDVAYPVADTRPGRESTSVSVDRPKARPGRVRPRRRRTQDASVARLGPHPMARAGSVVIVLTLFVHTTQGKATSAESAEKEKLQTT